MLTLKNKKTTFKTYPNSLMDTLANIQMTSSTWKDSPCHLSLRITSGNSKEIHRHLSVAKSQDLRTGNLYKVVAHKPLFIASRDIK